MSRPARIVVAALVGVVLGACSMLVAGDATRGDGSAGTADEPPAASDVAPGAQEAVLLIWTEGGLPANLGDAVAAQPNVRRVTEVRGDLLELAASRASTGEAVDVLAAGHVIPLDALSVEPQSYATFLPKGPAASIAALAPGHAVIGSTSARIRRLGPGATLVLGDGETLTVTAVVDDAFVGGAEVVVADGAVRGIATPRFVLVSYDGARDALEHKVREALPRTTAVRFRAPGETPFLRHGDAVLPQAAVKERFGEFSYRRGEGRELEIDERWVREHIVDADVPVLGRVRCHRAIVDELRAALRELEERNLAYLVTRDGYAGCFVPRLVSVDGGVSRHTWGIALDLNWPKNPQGQQGAQDRRLVDAMAARGFTWGGPWLVPDPAHFEWVGGPVQDS